MTADATALPKNLQPQVGDEITDVTALLYLSGIFAAMSAASF